MKFEGWTKLTRLMSQTLHENFTQIFLLDYEILKKWADSDNQTQKIVYTLFLRGHAKSMSLRKISILNSRHWLYDVSYGTII